MADPIAGLRVSRLFSDVLNRKTALDNLDLPLRDLDIIRGAAQAGVTSSDIKTISGLTSDVEKQAIAIYNEVIVYPTILSPLVNSRVNIDTNINLNGRAIATSFKFNALDDAGNIVSLDLSTSRSSAWSALGNAEDSISYGSGVRVTSGNSISLASIEFPDDEIIAKRFDSQIPTDAIPVTIDGVDYEVYAMKGIPITFNGFFRTARNLSISYNDIPGLNIPPSWTINTVDGSDNEAVYRNVGNNSKSLINYFKTSAKSRDISIYYPVNLITEIQLDNVGLTDFPTVILVNLQRLSLINGDLIVMPNLSDFNSLQYLDVSDNNLTRSSDSTLRQLSQGVIDRLPTSLVTFNAGKCFNGESTGNFGLISGVNPILPSLTTIDLDSNTNSINRISGISPGIGELDGNSSIATSVVNYSVIGNRLSELHESVQKSNTLRTVRFGNNGITGSIVFESPELTLVHSGVSNRHSLIDLSGKVNLEDYRTDNMTFSGSTVGTGIIIGCTALAYFRINNTNVSGALPNMSSNTNLRYFVSWGTQWSDQVPDNYSIGPDTLSGPRETLVYINISSSNLREKIHPTAFNDMPNMRVIRISSWGRGIDGEVPEFQNSFNITYISLDSNKLTGTIPLLSQNTRLQTLALQNNLLTGIVPAFELPALRTMYLHRNQLTGVGELNCPRLTRLDLSDNSLERFPAFNTFNVNAIQNLIMSNAFVDGNSTGYTEGSLASLVNLRNLNVVGSNLNQGTINKIIYDLNENYSANNRPGVVINLVGNAFPSQTDEILAIVSRLRNAGWTIGLD